MRGTEEEIGIKIQKETGHWR